MEKEYATHRIYLEARFDPSLTTKEKIIKFFLGRTENEEEIIECEAKGVDLVEISVFRIYAFNLETLTKEVRFYLDDLRCPKGRNYNLKIKVKKIEKLK